MVSALDTLRKVIILREVYIRLFLLTRRTLQNHKPKQTLHEKMCLSPAIRSNLSIRL
jgi:hypothetical protein